MADKPQKEPWTWDSEYIYADLLEVAGRKSEALTKYRALRQELNDTQPILRERVDEAVKRLS
jgi:hypothetical protein